MHSLSEDEAEEHTDHRGDGEGQQRPFEALSLFVNSQAGSGAGPVHEAEEHGGDGGDPGPAVRHQERVQFMALEVSRRVLVAM